MLLMHNGLMIFTPATISNVIGRFFHPLSLSTNPPLDIVFGFIMAPQGNATAGATLLRL